MITPEPARLALPVLRAALDLLTPEGAWTQGEIARDTKGKHAPSGSEWAVCWCSFGAIERFDKEPARGAHEFFRAANSLSHVANWNDHPTRTHAEVLDAFGRAIALAESVGESRAG